MSQGFNITLKSINNNFKRTIQLFEDMFQHDSCHHQFDALLRFPLF